MEPLSVDVSMTSSSMSSMPGRILQNAGVGRAMCRGLRSQYSEKNAAELTGCRSSASASRRDLEVLEKAAKADTPMSGQPVDGPVAAKA